MREVDGRWATQSRSVIEQKKIHTAACRVETLGARSTDPPPYSYPLPYLPTTVKNTSARRGKRREQRSRAVRWTVESSGERAARVPGGVGRGSAGAGPSPAPAERHWAARVPAPAGEGTGWSEGAARNPPATSGCAAQRPVLPPRQHKGEHRHHGRPRLPPRQRWTGSSTMASMADGEVRHDLLLLDTLRRRTNKICRGNRRERCPRWRSTWVISPGRARRPSRGRPG